MNKIKKDAKLLVLVESPNKKTSVQHIFNDLGYTNVHVLATIGHTTLIADNKKSYKNTGIHPEKSFAVDYQVDPDKAKVVREIKDQLIWADLVLIASDEDREGENLGYHIKEVLNLPEDKYYRISYRSITKPAIQEAIDNPTKFNMPLVKAAEARQIVDKMLGYTLSPIARKYVGAKSVGRCQSVGLKLVADREAEITNFIPETFYDVWLEFTKDYNIFKAKYIGTEKEKIDKIKDKNIVDKLQADCKDNDYIISDIKTKLRTEGAPQPFCTATFQQEASTNIGLGVKDAMSCAQKLFEGVAINGEHIGLITYHRTDCTDIADSFIPELKAYVETTYGKKQYAGPRAGKKQDNAQEGHEALRVTDPKLTPEKLESVLPNPTLVKVYRLIWKRTLASVMADATYDDTIYTISNSGHNFSLTTSQVHDLGFRVLYDNLSLPNIKLDYKVRDKIDNPDLKIQMKQTDPPARYKEASLVKALMKAGVGRPSTYATIVDTVLSKSRGYCVLDDKHIVPTERGLQLASFLDRSFSDIINLDYTKDLEDKLDAIANNKLEELDFLNVFYAQLVNTVEQNEEDSPTYAEVKCPICGEPMVVRRSRFGKLFYGCSAYPKCRGIVNI